MAAFAGGIVELMEFLEDRFEVPLRECRCPVSQTSMRSLSPRRRQPSRILPSVGVLHRVREQIADASARAGADRCVTVRLLGTTRQPRPFSAA